MYYQEVYQEAGSHPDHQHAGHQRVSRARDDDKIQNARMRWGTIIQGWTMQHIL